MAREREAINKYMRGYFSRSKLFFFTLISWRGYTLAVKIVRLQLIE